MEKETEQSTNDKKPALKLYAMLENPVVYAAVKSLFSFANEKQATTKLQMLKRNFATSKKGGEAEHSIILWIRGYEINEGEQALGYKGNFACLSVSKCDDGRFTILATKINSELKFHPERRRVKQAHPDWGQPILRDIKKKRVYSSLEEASDELRRLHQEYPEISIPSEHSLYIMLYEKIDGTKSPIQKYKFLVRPLPDGGYLIDFKRQRPKDLRAKKPKEVKGFFSQKEKIRQTMKKQKGVLLPTSGEAGEAAK
jgi:hypothetical protein